MWWMWIIIAVVAFFIFLGFTRWLGSKMYAEGREGGIRGGLRYIKDICCGGRPDED